MIMMIMIHDSWWSCFLNKHPRFVFEDHFSAERLHMFSNFFGVLAGIHSGSTCFSCYDLPAVRNLWTPECMLLHRNNKRGGMKKVSSRIAQSSHTPFSKHLVPAASGGGPWIFWGQRFFFFAGSVAPSSTASPVSAAAALAAAFFAFFLRCLVTYQSCW